MALMAGIDTQEVAWDLAPGEWHRKVENIAAWVTLQECSHESMLPANGVSVAVGKYSVGVLRRDFADQPLANALS